MTKISIILFSLLAAFSISNLSIAAELPAPVLHFMEEHGFPRTFAEAVKTSCRSLLPTGKASDPDYNYPGPLIMLPQHFSPVAQPIRTQAVAITNRDPNARGDSLLSTPIEMFWRPDVWLAEHAGRNSDFRVIFRRLGNLLDTPVEFWSGEDHFSPLPVMMRGETRAKVRLSKTPLPAIVLESKALISLSVLVLLPSDSLVIVEFLTSGGIVPTHKPVNITISPAIAQNLPIASDVELAWVAHYIGRALDWY